MTERTFRYLVTVLLIIPIIALVDVVARPVTQGNRDLREILYLLFSIPIGFLVYCAWCQPQVIREMFGPFRPENPDEWEFQSAVFSRINRRNLVFIGLGLGVLLICGGQFALGLMVASKFGLLPASQTPTSDFETTQTAAVATGRATNSLPTETPTPLESGPTSESILTETPASAENSPTPESVLPQTPQASPVSEMCAIGEQCQVNGIGVVVLSLSTMDSLDTSTAAPGNTYLVLEVIIQNLGRDDEMPYDPLYFSVQDANGVQYQAATASPNPAIVSGKLPKDSAAAGFVSFEVLSIATGFIATYNPGELLGGNPPIQIDLGQ
jgi:hypothetical protein